MAHYTHQVHRQLLELTVADAATARRLQAELARIQQDRLVPVLDRCLTAAAHEDRTAWIDRLELDLGTVDLGNLENGLAEAFEQALEDALAQRLPKCTGEARPKNGRARIAGRGEDLGPRAGATAGKPTVVAVPVPTSRRPPSDTARRLELLRFFKHTGRLPWWADVTDDRLLHEAVLFLAEHAPDTLAALVPRHLDDPSVGGPVHGPGRPSTPGQGPGGPHLPRPRVPPGSTAPYGKPPETPSRATVPSTMKAEDTAAVALRDSQSRPAAKSASLDQDSIEGGTDLTSPQIRFGSTANSTGPSLTQSGGNRSEIEWKPSPGHPDSKDHDIDPRARFSVSQSSGRRSGRSGDPEPEGRAESFRDHEGPSTAKEKAPQDEATQAPETPRAVRRAPPTLWAADRAQVEAEAAQVIGAVHGTWLTLSADATRSAETAATPEKTPNPENATPVAPTSQAAQPAGAVDRARTSKAAQATRLPDPVQAARTSRLDRLIRALEPQALEAWLTALQPPAGTDRVVASILRSDGHRDSAVSAHRWRHAVWRSVLLAAADSRADPAAFWGRAVRHLAAAMDRPDADRLEEIRTRIRREVPDPELTKSLEGPASESRSSPGIPPRRPAGSEPTRVRASASELEPASPAAGPLGEATAHLVGGPSTGTPAIETVGPVDEPVPSNPLGELRSAGDQSTGRTHLAVASPVGSPSTHDREDLTRVGSGTSLSERKGREPSAPTPNPPELAAPQAGLFLPDALSADTDSLPVDTAGSVLLWPFLSSLFQGLQLLEDGKFRDTEAQHRATGLLFFLATGDPEPKEWRLVMAKVLCGLPIDTVFDFGPPIRSREREPCEELLQAVLAHAPRLGELSISGLRGTFLIRPGTLTTRDGRWLLRVERRTYDLVLDRLPWSFDWIRLPFMEATMRVDWT